MKNLNYCLISSFFFFLASSVQAEAPIMATIVREEALRSQHDPNGRPLPLVASWERDAFPPSTQVQMIQNGIPLLPWIDMGNRQTDANTWLAASETNAIKKFKDWNIPFALLYGGQWEEDFYSASDYITLSVDQTGAGKNIDGSKMNNVSPFSPVEPWQALGNKWTNNPMIQLVQSLYPDPPLVFFISNNEAKKLSTPDSDKEKRYIDSYEPNKDIDFKNEVFGNGWIARYSALFQGMRDGLIKNSWKKNVRFVGYNAFGPDHLARWWSWQEYSLATKNRIAPDWYSWDGGIPEAYDNNWEKTKTAYNLWSVQSELMSLVFMKDEAFKVKPEFWFELIFWDGYSSTASDSKYSIYQDNRVQYTPELYSGWIQYSLWLLVPRVAREFRWSYSDPLSRFMPYFQQIISAVKRVHTDPILTRFWRKGELVPNQTRQHPFQANVPQNFSNANRWFDLNTNLDPSGTDYNLQWPVWTLARVLGEKPNREWLVYAHAPKGAKANVQVTIPDYKSIELPSISISGSFYHVIEATGAIKQVANGDSISAPAIKLKPML